MPDALASDARALAAAGLLVALPGVLVVRAPWRALPLLSLAFWILSWTWLAGGSRLRALQVLLAAFGVLAALRVLRPGPLPRLGRAQVLVATIALALVMPYALWPVAPGARMPVEVVTARLLAWRDGWPVSFEPLLPLPRLQASGLATFAADVVLLSGVAVHRAALLVALAGGAALLLALWSLAATYCAPARAATIAAAATLATAAPPGTGPGALAVALAAESAALGRDGQGAPSAFAAGATAAAALAVDPATALAALALAGVGAGFARSPAKLRTSRRLRVALLTAVALAVPLAVRTPPVAAPQLAPLIALALVLVLCRMDGAAPYRARWLAPAAAAVVVALAARAVALTLSAPPAVTPGEIAAMEWIRDHTRPLDVVCAPARPEATWIPSIAGRPTTVPVAAGWPASKGECGVWIELKGARPAGPFPRGRPAVRTATAAVWTMHGKN